MNHLLKTLAFILILICSSNLHAQPGGGIWAGSLKAISQTNTHATPKARIWILNNQQIQNDNTNTILAFSTKEFSSNFDRTITDIQHILNNTCESISEKFENMFSFLFWRSTL